MDGMWLNANHLITANCSSETPLCTACWWSMLVASWHSSPFHRLWKAWKIKKFRKKKNKQKTRLNRREFIRTEHERVNNYNNVMTAARLRVIICVVPIAVDEFETKRVVEHNRVPSRRWISFDFTRVCLYLSRSTADFIEPARRHTFLVISISTEVWE